MPEFEASLPPYVDTRALRRRHSDVENVDGLLLLRTLKECSGPVFLAEHSALPKFGYYFYPSAEILASGAHKKDNIFELLKKQSVRYERCPLRIVKKDFFGPSVVCDVICYRIEEKDFLNMLEGIGKITPGKNTSAQEAVAWAARQRELLKQGKHAGSLTLAPEYAAKAAAAKAAAEAAAKAAAEAEEAPGAKVTVHESHSKSGGPARRAGRSPASKRTR